MDPQVKDLIEKTAIFISGQGYDFESKLLEKEKNNPKFSFLHKENDNHKYYRERIEFLKNQKTLSELKENKWYDKIIESAMLSAPPLEIEIIKLTAQFIALNGKSFMHGLQTRHKDQFTFLENDHHLNAFFQFLLESYETILKKLSLENNKELETDDLEEEREKELEKILEKVKWNRLKQDEKGEKGEKEATTMASLIDWSEFIVVSTISFNEDQSSLLRLPPPLTLTQLRSVPFLPPKTNTPTPTPTQLNSVPPQNFVLPQKPQNISNSPPPQQIHQHQHQHN